MLRKTRKFLSLSFLELVTAMAVFREIGHLCRGCPFWRACGADSPDPAPYLKPCNLSKS